MSTESEAFIVDATLPETTAVPDVEIVAPTQAATPAACGASRLEFIWHHLRPKWSRAVSKYGCTLCSKSYKLNKPSGHSAMETHLGNVHGLTFKTGWQPPAPLQPSGTLFQRTLVQSTPDSSSGIEAFARPICLLVRHGVPMRISRDPDFDLMQRAQLALVTARNMRQKIIEVAAHLRHTILHAQCNRIASLAADSGTTNAISCTAMVIRTCDAGGSFTMCPVDTAQHTLKTQEAYTQLLTDRIATLQAAGIRVSSVVTDNAASLVAGVHALAMPGLVYVRCVAHCIQLVLECILRSTEAQDATALVASCKSWRAPVHTRWWSTLASVDRENSFFGTEPIASLAKALSHFKKD